MSDKRYPEEFKIEVVKQVVDRGHSLSSEAIRLGITTHQSDAQAEIRLLQKCSSELRLTGHIKKTAAYFARLSDRGTPLSVTIIVASLSACSVRSWMRIRVGFYAWLRQSHSRQYHADLKLTGQIKQFWLESGCVYGYRSPSLSAGYLTTVWGKQSLAVNETCRDKGSGRVSKPTGA